jgi:hypothetical protein
MYLCLPFNFLSMFWCGIMMAGMRQTFSTEPPKTKKKQAD